MPGQESTNGRKQQGRFEGEVMARLDSIERRFDRNNDIIFEKLDSMDGKITDLKVNVGVSKGVVGAIAAIVSATVALITAWAKTK